MKKNVIVFLILLTAMVSCLEPEGDWRKKSADPENLHKSIKQITDVIVHDIFSPPVASRIYAYASIAGYEAAIQADSRFQSLATQLNGLDSVPQPEPGLEYSYELASVQAVLRVGKTLVFSEDKMDVFYE